MKDPFTYSARWGSIGLGCSFCKHVKKIKWPDLNNSYSCMLHEVSLVKTLDSDGYIEGEWFCSSFSGDAFSKSVQELDLVKKKLKTNILYGAYGKDGKLKQIPFTEL